VVTFETSGQFSKHKLTCQTETDKGTITGTRTETLNVTLTGCEDAASKVPCQSEGAAMGEIVDYPLEGELGFIKGGEKPSVGLDLKPAGLSAPVLASFECSGSPGQVLLEGSAIGALATSNLISLTHKLTFTQKKQATRNPNSSKGIPKTRLPSASASLNSAD